MNVKKLIRDTLIPIGIPVSALSGNNSNDAYIIYNEFNQASALDSDDEEVSTKYFYQVDVFSKDDFTDLLADVEARLKAAGFKRMYSSETYDEEAEKFRKILRFSYATDLM